MKNLYILNILFFVVFNSFSFAQDEKISQATQNILNSFDKASVTYNVPVDLLKAISYTETRFSNIIEPANSNQSRIYPVTYGIMGLRNDARIGHSLLDGATLINQPPEIVAVNPVLNIEAAAALLNSIADSLKIDRSNLNNWRPVIEEYSGIPQKDIQPFFSFDVFKVLSDGTNLKEITISRKPQIDMNQFSKEVNPKSKNKNIESIQTPHSIDYPPAYWIPSPNFTPNAITPLFLVVHDTECNFAVALSILTDPNNNGNPVSSHYLIRSSDGYIVQLVREHDRAWHVGCWNPYMIGVEHEGYVSDSLSFTDTMYKASADLYRHLIETWGVSLDSNHVIGHDEHLYSWWRNYIYKNYPYIDPTCNTHTDPGQYWKWNYFFSLIRSDATTPSFSSYSPTISADSVWTNTRVIINFSMAMDQASTQNAFSILPQVQGKFSWQNYSHTLVFMPSELLLHSTKYTVILNQSASGILGVHLGNSLNFTFDTKPFTPLALAKSYPAANEAGVSSSVKFIIRFNIPIIYGSLGGRVLLQDSSGNNLIIRNPVYSIINNEGVLAFFPYSNLPENSKFKIILKAGIQSINGSLLSSDTVIEFATGKSNFVKGTEVDNFEAINNWQQPEYSGSTKGVDTSQTKFDIVYGTNIDGFNSGRITYLFNDSTGGVCRVYDADKPNLGSGRNDNFGMWVFGDASNNYLEYWFYINSNQNVVVRADTLNWTGWKFVEIPMSKIVGSGDVLFQSVVIVQNSAGEDSGMVYLDEAQYRDPAVNNIKDYNSFVAGNFFLSQNYPNPFNPSTTIQYTVPSGEIINASRQLLTTLKVYDVLGREVATLVNENKSQGIYSVVFSAGNLPSGIYFYRLNAESVDRKIKYSSIKKMILLK
ncbi:MAG: N-acetylmuramoyl-L-alanine amidase [Ignavibacteriaceae bacterium]